MVVVLTRRGCCARLGTATASHHGVGSVCDGSQRSMVLELKPGDLDEISGRMRADACPVNGHSLDRRYSA